MWTSKRELKRRNEWQAQEIERLLKILTDNGIRSNWIMPGETRTVKFTTSPPIEQPNKKG